MTGQPALLGWCDLTARPRPVADLTLAYGADAMQCVDVWLPRSRTPLGTVLMVHGGCWQSDVADRTLMDWAASDLRERGVAVWNIDYRGVDRIGGGYPGTFRDVARASDMLRDHTRELRLDMSKIVALGHSAGGHLALWLAARHRLPATSPIADHDPLPIRRVVGLGALPDLERAAKRADHACGTEVIASLVGTHSDPYADTSVPRLLPIGVPHDLVNGRDDHIVALGFGEDYVRKAQAAGDDARLHIVPATGHVELVTPGTDAWTLTCRLIEEGFRA